MNLIYKKKKTSKKYLFNAVANEYFVDYENEGKPNVKEYL